MLRVQTEAHDDEWQDQLLSSTGLRRFPRFSAPS